MKKSLIFALLLFLLVDVTNASLPGLFEFSEQDSENGLHRTRERQIRPLVMAVEPVRTSPDVEQPTGSRSRLPMCQIPSRPSWTTAPCLRSSVPRADAAADDD